MVQELATGLRREVTAFPGINGAPAFSPDGRRLALTLSRDGSPDIYVLTLESGGVAAPDQRAGDRHRAGLVRRTGGPLVFTSDRSGGRPQLFRISAAGGGAPERLTFEGRYKRARGVLPRTGPGSRSCTSLTASTGSRVMGIGDERIEVLTNGRLDESPTFAPNGRLILYATTERGRSALAAVSIDGRFRQRLSIDETGVRDPAWSPRLSRR